MSKSNLVKILALAGMMLGAASANASLLCSDGATYTGDLSTSDVTFRSNNADDCYGQMSGNDSGAHRY